MPDTSLQCPAPLSPAEREAILASVVTSMALDGIIVPYEQASVWLDEALKKPLPRIEERNG